MKHMFKSVLYWTTILSTMAVVVGCGQSSEETTNSPVVGGGPGYSGYTTPLPGGGAQVNFTGTNVYATPTLMSGGNAPNGTYCGIFTGSIPGHTDCWAFMNAYRSGGSGTMGVGGPGATPGAGSVTYTGTSIIEPQASIVMTTSNIVYEHGNVTGTIVLPPAFIQRNFANRVIPAFVNVALDLWIESNATIRGGVLIYTGPTSGVFLKIWY